MLFFMLFLLDSVRFPSQRHQIWYKSKFDNNICVWINLSNPIYTSISYITLQTNSFFPAEVIDKITSNMPIICSALYLHVVDEFEFQ